MVTHCRPIFLEHISELADNVVSFFCDIASMLKSPIGISRPSSAIAPSLSLQINFKSRLGAHNAGNNCLMTINRTGFRIHQKGPAARRNTFTPHKYASKSTLHYELGVDILMGNLIWISGPCPVGKYTDRPLSQARRAGGGRQRLCGACQQNKGPQQ